MAGQVRNFIGPTKTTKTDYYCWVGGHLLRHNNKNDKKKKGKIVPRGILIKIRVLVDGCGGLPRIKRTAHASTIHKVRFFSLFSRNVAIARCDWIVTGEKRQKLNVLNLKKKKTNYSRPSIWTSYRPVAMVFSFTPRDVTYLSRADAHGRGE